MKDSLLVRTSTGRGELPGLGPLTINLNINAKTNGIDVNNILT